MDDKHTQEKLLFRMEGSVKSACDCHANSSPQLVLIQRDDISGADQGFEIGGVSIA